MINICLVNHLVLTSHDQVQERNKKVIWPELRQEIKTEFRRISKLIHPDKCPLDSTITWVKWRKSNSNKQ